MKDLAHGGVKQLDVTGPILDLSVNISPNGPSPAVLEAIQKADYSSYPDPQYRRLKKAISAKYQVSADRIHLGNGAIDIIHRLPQTYPRNKELAALVVEPCFSEFKKAWQNRGRVDGVVSLESEDFALPWDRLTKQLQTNSYQICYLCNPASPTGVSFRVDRVRQLAEQFPATDFVLDLAFIQYSQHSADQFAQLPANVLRLFSLTKEHALAGLRIGFAISSVEKIRLLDSSQCRWAINSCAEAAAIVCCQDDRYAHAAIAETLANREYLTGRLVAAGRKFFVADAPYLLIQVGSATAVCEALLQRFRIFVRPCDSFGLPKWIRVFPSTRPAIDQLMQALQQLENL